MKNNEITKKQLCTFGIALTILLLVISSISYFKQGMNYQITGTVSALILLTTLLTPALLKPIYKLFIFISYILGWINTRLLLGLIFYLIFTPVALILKIIGKDPLNRKFDPKASSYWQPGVDEKEDRESYYRQF